MYKKIYIVIACLVTCLLCACQDKTEVISDYEEQTVTAGEGSLYEEAFDTQAMTDTQASQNDSSNGLIAVYVCGAVAHPGVYYIEEAAIVLDALNEAGGMLEEAADNYVNLAEHVSDGDKLYFPYSYELDDYSPITDSGTYNQEAVYEAGGKEAGLVNINTADSNQLMTLPGIGRSKADAIIKYREEQGTFAGIEDIQRVSGIGESTYNNIKESITVK